MSNSMRGTRDVSAQDRTAGGASLSTTGILGVLIQRADLSLHFRWMAFILAVAAGATAWYLASSWQSGEWPTGSSPVGFACGVVGGAIIVFECLLWLRKKFRARRWGRTYVWMQAHVWLGLLCLPLLVLHSGFYLGGLLSTVLMILLIAVVGSGVLGLVLQQFIPRQMLEWIPEETIHSQIDVVVRGLLEDARLLVDAAAGHRAANSRVPLAAAAIARDDDENEYQTVGAARGGRRPSNRVLQVEVPEHPIEGGERLGDFFDRQVEPFMRGQSPATSPLQSPVRARPLFEDLRTQFGAEGRPIVDALERLCEQRRQFDMQRRLHGWLHGWLVVHVPLSAALLILMFMHAVAALKYW